MNSALKLYIALTLLLVPSCLQASLPRPLTILKGAAAVSFMIYSWVKHHTIEYQNTEQQISLLQNRVNQIAQQSRVKQLAQYIDLRRQTEENELDQRLKTLRTLKEYHLHS